MKHRFLPIQLIFLFILFAVLHADVWTSSNISGNVTWTKNNSSGDGIYIVDVTNDTLMIDSLSTLTIEPGVTVKFHDDIMFLVKGSLIASGTVTDSIIFTLDDASGSATEWGGIKLESDSSAANILQYCRIEHGDADNTSPGAPYDSKTGGGIYCGPNIYSTTQIRHCTIQNNNAFEGGGGVFIEGSPVLEANMIRNNSAGQYGGGVGIKGLSLSRMASPVFDNNIIISNHADGQGGAGVAFFANTNVVMTNDMIYKNISSNGSGGGVKSFGASSLASIKNAIIYDNSADTENQVSGAPGITYSDIQGAYTGEGNIDADPQFNDAANGDFHVQATSPIVDTGDNTNAPAKDFDENDRPFDGDRDGTVTTDMGPYEYLNTAPQITSVPVTEATEDQQYTYQVTADDPDAGEQLTYSLTNGPEFLSIDASTGLISGTATTDADSGDHSVTVQVADLNGATDTQTYTLHVTAVNDAPVVSGIPDQTIDEGQTFTTINLDDYVTDEESSPSEMTWSYSGNLQLSVSIDANHVATITIPDSNWYGSENITFTATDPGGLSGSDQATFTVNNVNDAPVVSDIPDQTIDEGQTFTTINLDDYVEDIDNVKSDLTWTYSGNTDLSVSIDENRVATIIIPDTNWYGSETITFTATDPGGLSDSDPARFTVNAVNDAPVVSDIPDQTIDEGQSFVSIQLDNYVDDVDNADSEMDWTYSGNHDLEVTISADRVATIAIPNTDWFGAETITFTATDPGGLSDSDPAVFTVHNVNDAPVAVNDSSVTDEDVAVTIHVLNNDTDIDGDQLVVESTGDPQHGTATISQDSLVIYTPQSDWSGNDQFDYTVSDGHGGSATATVFVTVNAVNDAPVVSDIPDQSITEGQSFTTISLDDYVNDVDNPDNTLEWNYAGNTDLTVSIDANRVATITPPDSNWNGSETITFTATDPGGLSASDTAKFTVNGINDAPVVSDIPDQTIAEGQSFSTIALDNFVSDEDNADSEIGWTISGNKELIVTIDSLTRVATVSAPDSNWNGSETLLFKATDPAGASDSDRVVFTVTPVNDAPVLAAIADQTIQEGQSFATLHLDELVSDVDDVDSTLIWEVTGNTELTVTIDSNRVLTVTVPGPEWNGSERLLFKVSDPAGLFDTTTVVYTVTPVNDPPHFTESLPNLTFNEDDSLLFEIAGWYPYAEDQDNADSTLTFTVSGGKYVQHVLKHAAYKFSASENWFGSDTLELIVSDGFLADTASFVVTVNSINDPPMIVGLPETIRFRSDSSAILMMKEYARDVDSPDSLLSWSFSVSNDSLVYTYDAETGQLKLTAAGFSGEVQLTCILTDDSSAQVSDTIQVQVDPVTALEDMLSGGIPEQYELNQNYPNPFNPVTNIRYGLPQAGKVRISVYNILGKKVATLVDTFKPAGYHTIRFDASRYSSGVYFYRIEAKNFVKVRKMILMK